MTRLGGKRTLQSDRWRPVPTGAAPFDKADSDLAFCGSHVGVSASVVTGQFNRRETPSQTSATALLQVASGEIWGRTPRNGIEPTVQAYAGKLKNRRGIDFITNTEPHPDGSPFEVRWYMTLTPGVLRRYQNGEEFACIKATVTNMQP